MPKKRVSMLSDMGQKPLGGLTPNFLWW